MRPWIPPALLISLTKRLIAFVCSPYSTSVAKPSFPASELRFTIGNTTLMEVAVTPRVLVLAFDTGVGWVAATAAPAAPAPPGTLEGARSIHRTRPTITATISRMVRTCTARDRRRNRRHDRPNGASGLTCNVDVFMFPLALTFPPVRRRQR